MEIVRFYNLTWNIFLSLDRSNSDGGANGQTGIQRYTTSKYTNAIHAGLCTLTPTYDKPPRSNSTTSQPDYRVRLPINFNCFIVDFCNGINII